MNTTKTTNMNTTAKRQTAVAGKTHGGLMNYLMAHNASLPEVGKGMTELMWSDRHAYEVMSVSPDGTRVVVQAYEAERTDNNGYYTEAQDYKYEKLSGYDRVLVWKWNAWRWENTVIEFTPEFAKTVGPKSWEDAEFKALWDENGDLKLVEGKTRSVKKYDKVHVLFGTKQEYRDPTF